MSRYKSTYFDFLDIKLHLGYLQFNILYIRLNCFSAKEVIENHCHSSYELHYIIDGHGAISIDGISYKVQQGDFFLTGPGIYHKQSADGINPMVEYCINFDYKSKNTSMRESMPSEEILEIEKLLKGTSFYIGKDEFNNVELFKRTFWELENKHIGYYTNIINYINLIIISTLRSLAVNKTADYKIPIKDLNIARHQLLDDLFSYNYMDITADMAADVLKISKRQLHRVLKQYYGKSFKDVLLDVKLENAAHLLKSSKMSIKDISSKTGFNSPCYFSKMFKAKIGKTPQEYRH